MRSPWESALGDRIESLHPRLREYFAAIPDGSVGIGEGVFDVVGTPRRWLWPLFGLLGSDVLFPVWQHNVPFTVHNRARGSSVVAVRMFAFERGQRHMRDEIGFTGELWDRLGHVVATLEASVYDGGLELYSTRVRLAGIPIPRWLAPRLTLTERWDDASACQRVSLVLVAPLVGRLYEYAGSFTYRIVDQ